MANNNLIETKTSVNTKILASKDGSKTFSIRKEIEGIDGSHACFILLYPTRTAANCYTEDKTNNHLLNHLEELGLNAYTIINLFSQVTQSRLSMSALSVDEENMEFIRKNIFAELTDDSKVVIAWGSTQENSPVVCRSKQRILELWEGEQPSRPLYQLTASGLKNDNIGVHPLFLGIRHSNSVWRMINYPYKNVMRELAERMKPKKNGKEENSGTTAKNSTKGKKKTASE